MCIDASYLLFYRLNALLTWHKHGHKRAVEKATESGTDLPPSPTKSELLRSDLFRTKLCDRLDATIQEWVTRHRPCVVLLAFDGHNNWRKALYSAYKGTRQHESATLELFRHGEAHLKRTYGGPDTATKLTQMTPESPVRVAYQPPPPSPPPPSSRKRQRPTPPPFVLAHHDRLEADDLIHEMTRRWMTPAASASTSTSTTSTTAPTPAVVILANDHDYLPLLEYANTHLIRLPNTALTVPDGCTPQEFLQMKILMGDKSDNIGPVFVKPSLRKGVAQELVRTAGALETKLADADAATRARWARNRELIDNRLVPEEVGGWMVGVGEMVDAVAAQSS